MDATGAEREGLLALLDGRVRPRVPAFLVAYANTRTKVGGAGASDNNARFGSLTSPDVPAVMQGWPYVETTRAISPGEEIFVDYVLRE